MLWHKKLLEIRQTCALGFSLAGANFKLRNEGSYLGILWYLLDPLLMFAVLFLIFSRNIGSGIDEYPLYLLLGLIVNNFFASTTSQAVSVIAGSAPFIKSIKMPSEALVVGLVLRNIYSHVFEMLIFCAFLVFFKISLLGLIFYLPIYLIFVLFTAGVSFILATLGVYANDLQNVWKFVLQLIFFASAIFYGFEINNPLLKLNPIAHFINLARTSMIYHQSYDPRSILVVVSCSFLIFGFGIILFKKKQVRFAERI